MELNSWCSGIKWSMKWSFIIPCEDSLKHLHQCCSDCHGGKDPPMSTVVNCLVAVSYEHQGESEFRYMALCMTPACSLCHDLRWIQSLSRVQLYVSPCTAACQASMPNTNSQNLFKLMSIESVMPCNHLILYDPLLILLSIISSIRVFFKSQLFTSGGQSTGVLASASLLPMTIQDWFPLGWTGWISLQSKGLSRVFSNTTVQKHQFFCVQFAL